MTRCPDLRTHEPREGFAANWRGGSGRYDSSRALPIWFPSRSTRLKGIASPAEIRLAIERSTAAASSLQASGCIGSSESVRVSKEMRIIGTVVLILNWWNGCRPGCFVFHSYLPTGRSRRRESAAEPGLLHLSSCLTNSACQPPPEVPQRPIHHQSGKVTCPHETLPCGEHRGVRCQGWDPGLQQRETWVPFTARGAEPLEQTGPSKPVRPRKDPVRSRRIRGCEAPQDWSDPGRQEFVGACGGSRAGAPKERREIAVLIRQARLARWGLGRSPPRRMGCGPRSSRRGKTFPRKGPYNPSRGSLHS